MDFWDALVHWARVRPHHFAVRTASHELTYAQLADLTAQLATTLAEVPHQRVGILTSEPAHMALGFQACALSGKTLVVLDPAWPASLLSDMVARLGCTHLIAQDLPAALLENNLSLIDVPQSSSGCELSPCSNVPERELLIICTSGTTSHPKAILRSAQSWTKSINAGASILGATDQCVTLSPGPVSHGLGLYSLVESLQTGGTFVGAGRWDANRTASLLRRVSCNRIVSVPTILQRMLDSLDSELVNEITCVVSGGESLSAELVDRLYDLPKMKRCVEYFGSSEHSLIAYSQRAPRGANLGSFTGVLFPGVKVHLHDHDTPTGTGQVYVDSPFNAKGYLTETAPPIARCNKSTSIGDRASLVGQQGIVFQPRSDGMLILNGNNIYVQELEQVFAQIGLPQVKIRVSDGRDQACLIAYVCSAPVDEQSLQKQLAQLLPTYKIPHEIVFLSQWPQTFSGKAKIPSPLEQANEIMKRVRLR
ncbi:class I adenylate-forming enzyme family protein [Glutamicibacter sp. JC586]|uniref:class I adenylate-forming enzyme family protein n=1 Tax=Glutamicibacter sp. JC586 TaxID=2590552 RepID=UPI002101DC9A|nr:class I adenylate-forming enzyme family protein [Glutamicibacter sp. JC586]